MHINAFGNIENKDIELSNGINVIYGKNEAGKSTLLKFIVDMLYGISKNKRGKDFSDYDRFKPWNKEEFSGKISYSLDNGRKYEIFRDFNKKNPVIYDEELNDISKDFTIDKTNGSEFFVEQTKIDENTFLSTLASAQQEVRLEKQDQNLLVQKIANLAGTGEDNVSYKKAVDKINKRQLEEIGTSRSQGRPINVVKDEKYKLQDEIGELEEFKDKQYEIEEIKQNLEKEIAKDEKNLEVLKQLKQIDNQEELEKQKIQFNMDIIENNNEKISDLNKQKEEKQKEIDKLAPIAKNEKKQKQKNLLAIISLVLTLLFAVLTIVFKNNKIVFIIIGACLGISAFSFILSIIIYNNKMKKIEKKMEKEVDLVNKQKQDVMAEINRINSQLELLNKTNKEQQEEIERQETVLNVQKDIRRQEILNKYNIEDNNNYDIEALQTKINNNKLEIHQLDLEKDSIIPKLEKLADMEENLEQLNQKEEELLRENEAIECAKQVLETAYIKMKQNVTPKFTKRLSDNIDQISNGRYKNVKINDEEGIIIEKENGEYISCEKLSVGTIDQLYLSLRFGAIKELSDENMPIILDEAFAYYDEERLENILKYINTEFKDNQVIIFTCTNREKEMLQKNNIDVNYITI